MKTWVRMSEPRDWSTAGAKASRRRREIAVSDLWWAKLKLIVDVFKCDFRVLANPAKIFRERCRDQWSSNSVVFQRLFSIRLCRDRLSPLAPNLDIYFSIELKKNALTSMCLNIMKICTRYKCVGDWRKIH